MPRRPLRPDGRLIRGDLRRVLARLPAAFADLAYLDPPFGTGRDFGAYDDRPTLHRCNVNDPDVAEDGLPADDRIRSVLALCHDDVSIAWISMLGLWLLSVRRAVKPTGAIWVHVDERRAHLVRLLCDALLRPAVWRSTVIWSYRRWPSRSSTFQHTHDVLFLYQPEAGGTFKVIRDELAPSTVASWGTNKTEAIFDEHGKRVRAAKTDEPSAGPAMGDVWPISIIAPNGIERRRGSKYKTQKPESLIERVVLSTSNPGDVVLDPACGSGTTLAVARRLGRRWVGIDKGEEAIRAVERRLGVRAERETSEAPAVEQNMP